MFYSEDIIEQVRTENDIVDVIGDYVKLQKKDTKTGTLMSISIPWNMAKGIMSFPE